MFCQVTYRGNNGNADHEQWNCVEIFSFNSFAFLITCLGYVINRTHNTIKISKKTYFEIKIRYENSISEKMCRRNESSGYFQRSLSIMSHPHYFFSGQKRLFLLFIEYYKISLSYSGVKWKFLELQKVLRELLVILSFPLLPVSLYLYECAFPISWSVQHFGLWQS